MRPSRWQHLDRNRPAPAESPALDPPAERESGACRLPPDPSLYAARGHYGLRQFEACADAVRSVLAGAERPPAGAHRLLGVALGRLREPRGAIAALRRALEEEGPDPRLLAGLLSAQIQARELPDELPVRASGPLAEVSAAAHWLRGQSRLADGEASPAARDFSQASVLFTPASLPGRLAACYVGLSVSHLLAGHPEAAAQAWGRTVRGAPAGAGAEQFARGIWEIATAVEDLEAPARAEALAPLRELVLRIRLAVGFYDGSGPVSIAWTGLPWSAPEGLP